MGTEIGNNNINNNNNNKNNGKMIEEEQEHQQNQTEQLDIDFTDSELVSHVRHTPKSAALDEAEGEEEEGGVGGVRKWTIEEDKRLVNAWIDTSTGPIISFDQKKSGFWGKVAAHFNKHAPRGATPRTGKVCNSRWNRAAPLVSKWTCIMEEMLLHNQSGTSMEDVLYRAHELYIQQTGKRFELEHWWRLLRDQPKWKSFCGLSEGGLSKRTKLNEMGEHCDTYTPAPAPAPTPTPAPVPAPAPPPVNEDPGVEEGGGLSRPNGSKVIKRKARERAVNTIVDLVTNQLSTLGTTAIDKVDLLRQYVKVQERKAAASEEAVRVRHRYQALKERQQEFKERQWEERVLRMNTTDMCPEDAAYYGQLQEHIRSRYRRPPLNELLTADDSSYSSSSSDGLSCILEESSDDTPILEEFLDDESDAQQMSLLVKLRQATEQMRALLLSKRRRKKRFIRRDREEAHERLYKDYFVEGSVYDEHHFRRRFRMRKNLFIRIMEALGNHSEYFQLRYDGLGRQGLTPLIKCTAAMWMLAYGISIDCLDKYLKVGESTALECMKKFARGVVTLFGEEYLRKPTQADVDRLLEIGDARDFPGMLGSIDCMHWEWKNCPTTWKIVFAKGPYKVPTIILQIIASYDLWIWHAFFGYPRSLNDIKVFDHSPAFYELYEDRTPKCEYVVNGHKYTIGYFLSDGICPKWSTFVKTVPLLQDSKAKLFAQHQEMVRRDVQRAFSVLQARFTIIRGPARFMEEDDMALIMKACIILHNMIIEDERDSYDLTFDYEHMADSTPEPNIQHDHHPCYTTYFQRSAQVRDPETHACLQEDLVEEIWKRNLKQERHE